MRWITRFLSPSDSPDGGGTGALTLDDAVAALRPTGESTPDPAPGDAPAPDKEPPPEKPAADPAKDDDELPDVDPAELSADDPAKDDDAPFLTLDVDGKATPYTKAQAEAALRGSSDLTTKQQAIAAERTQYAERLAEATQLLTVLRQGIAGEEAAAKTPEELLAMLDAGDVEGVERERLQREAREGRKGKIDALLAELAARTQAETARTHQERVAEEWPKLMEAVPAWQNEAVFRKAMERTKAFAVKSGYTEAEFDGIVDHRHLVMLHMAELGTRLVEKAKAKIVERPATDVPVLAPGARTPPVDVKAKIHGERVAKFAESRSEDDAVAVLRGLAAGTG